MTDTRPADVPAGAAQPAVLGAEEVREMREPCERLLSPPVLNYGPEVSYARSVVALARSHELLRARLEEAEGKWQEIEHPFDQSEYDAMFAAALAGGRAADALRLAGGMLQFEGNIQGAIDLILKGVEAYDAETGGAG